MLTFREQVLENLKNLKVGVYNPNTERDCGFLSKHASTQLLPKEHPGLFPRVLSKY